MAAADVFTKNPKNDATIAVPMMAVPSDVPSSLPVLYTPVASHYGGQSSDDPQYFYFRQLWDGKGSFDVDAVTGKGLRQYAWLCGAALGLAHARAGDAAMITGYLGDDDTFDRVIADFARAYVTLNEADHAAHQGAIASGSILAERDI